MNIKSTIDFYAFYKKNIKMSYAKWLEKVLDILNIGSCSLIITDLTDKCDENLFGAKSVYNVKINDDQVNSLIYYIIRDKWNKA
jgi:hypothetical protein